MRFKLVTQNAKHPAKHCSKKLFIYPARQKNFISLCRNNVETIVNDVFSQLPPQWQTPNSLAERMITFLSSSERITHLQQLTQHYTFKK